MSDRVELEEGIGHVELVLHFVTSTLESSLGFFFCLACSCMGSWEAVSGGGF